MMLTRSSKPAAMVVALLLATAAFAQRPIVEIKVAGAQRIPASAVIAASGLRMGQPVARAELDAATQKLFETGYFSGINYRYDPKPVNGVNGYAVTLMVQEEPLHTQVVLDIPGQDEDQLWQQIQALDKFVARQIPDNDRAQAYFQHTVERMLQKSGHPEEMVIKQEANLGSGQTTLICRPAHLPRVGALRFEGNSAVSSGALEAQLAKVAMDQEYTDREFSRWLELNVRPHYEELGRLTVAFRQLKTEPASNGAVAVTAVIDEGPVWRLGKIAVTGDGVPAAAMLEAGHYAEGLPANWKEFTRSMQNAEMVLRRDGYIAVNSKAVRSFREGEHVVDVNIQVNKGRQFMFGEMHIEGLDGTTQQRLASQWKLSSGAPLNEPYTNEFIKEVMPSLHGKVKSVSTELRVRKDSSIVDVIIKFR